MYRPVDLSNHSHAGHMAPCWREQMANQSPLGVSFPKPSSFKASCSQPNFCKPQWQVLFWALNSWESSESLLLQRPAKYCLLVQQWPQPLPNRFCLTFRQLLSLLFQFHWQHEKFQILSLMTWSVCFKNFLQFAHGWCDAHPTHGQSSPSFYKVPSPRSGKIWNCKSGIQTFGIRRHCLPSKIIMGLALAHGAQKRWIMVTLWRLSPNPCCSCRQLKNSDYHAIRLVWVFVHAIGAV